jgi:hypothetical protein
VSPRTGVVCDFCGSGVVEWDECPDCGGLGGDEITGARCHACEGYGITDKAHCNSCGAEPIGAQDGHP